MAGELLENLNIDQFNNIRIPLPPLEKQQEIEEVEQYQNVIDGARRYWKLQATFSAKKLKDVEIESYVRYLQEVLKDKRWNTMNQVLLWLVSGDIHATEIFDCEGRISELD